MWYVLLRVEGSKLTEPVDSVDEALKHGQESIYDPILPMI